MSEFNNRMDAQRHILKIINTFPNWKEPLYGLSRKAIERWVYSNKLDQSHSMVICISKASEALFFMANKSQEHLTEEYDTILEDIKSLSQEIERHMIEYTGAMSKNFTKFPLSFP